MITINIDRKRNKAVHVIDADDAVTDISETAPPFLVVLCPPQDGQSTNAKEPVSIELGEILEQRGVAQTEKLDDHTLALYLAYNAFVKISVEASYVAKGLTTLRLLLNEKVVAEKTSNSTDMSHNEISLSVTKSVNKKDALRLEIEHSEGSDVSYFGTLDAYDGVRRTTITVREI